MPGTRTAPTVGALTVSENQVGLHMVDASGDLFVENLILAGGALTDMADIEAWAVQYQANSNASLYKITQSVIWEGALDPDNALALFRASVAEGINLLFRDVTVTPSTAAGGRVIAPISTIMEGNQDIPLLVSPLTLLVTQYLNMLAGGYGLESMQFTGRRERKNNPRIRT